MNVHFHKNFLKNYQLRITPNSKLEERFHQRLELFLNDPEDSVLKDHKLGGDKAEYRAFSVTKDVRVIYKIVKDGVLLYDIGTHEEVY